MHYSIREANREDHKALNELFDEGDRFHREALPYLFQAPDGPARSEEFLSRVVSSDDSLVLIAEHEGLAVGLISLLVKEAPPIPILKPRRYAVVENLYVKEAARRVGIGAALIEAGLRGR